MSKHSGTRNGNQTELVTSHLHLVTTIARGIYKSLPAHADREDLLAAGMLGLLDAAIKYDPRKNSSFRSYAKHRIRGAIRDYQRRLDPLSRDLRRMHRVADRAIAHLNVELKRTPTEEEIARYLKLPLKRWRAFARQLYEAGFPVNGDGYDRKPTIWPENLKAHDGNPESHAAGEKLRRILNQAIRSLPPRYQKVIRLYYGREWTMQAIGRELGVKESRVSQMHRAALTRMRLHFARRGYAHDGILP